MATAKKKRARPGRPAEVEQEKWIVDGDFLTAYTPAKNGGVYFVPTDEILVRNGWKVYRQMRHDPQVKACMAFKKLLVYGRAYEIKPADDTAKAKEIAEFIEFALRKLNVKALFKEALTALDFGFSVGELVWEACDYKSAPKYIVGAIKHRDPEKIEILTDFHGNILGFKQQPRLTGKDIELEPNKAWHYAHDSEFQNHYGRSDLRAAYRSWWAKKFIINFWNVYLERMGHPLMMMKYPQGSSEPLKEKLKSILKGLSAKSEILVPAGVEVDLIEAQRSGNADYNGSLVYHDHEIARSLLVVALLGTGGDNVARGSDSQARLHLRTLFKMSDELGRDLVYSFCKQVIEPLVDMNYEHENLYPQFLWQDYGEFEGIEVADTIRQLFAAGIIDMDQSDINYTRSILGLPLRGENDPEDETIRPQPLPPPGNGTPPPAAPQNNDRAEKGAGGNRKTNPGTGRKR